MTHLFPVMIMSLGFSFNANPQFKIKCIFINIPQQLSSLKAWSLLHLAPINIQKGWRDPINTGQEERDKVKLVF